MLLIEIGNTTVKLARLMPDGEIHVERIEDVDQLIEVCRGSMQPVLCAPVGLELSNQLLPHLASAASLQIVSSNDFQEFVADSYDTPETLGLDRILNLAGLQGNGVVVSCGTAITVDALVDGRPRWGAIVPGFTTATQGLHQRIPLLPPVSLDATPVLPARTTRDSLANGVLLVTARGVRAIAEALVADVNVSVPVVLTGGDAEVMLRLWDAPGAAVDDVLLFRGMLAGGG
jgi:pantothenate kinase type III